MNDFSERNIKKQVTGAIVQHPASLLPISLGIIGGYAVLLNLIESPFFIGIVLGIVGLGVLSFLVNTLRRKNLENKYITSLNNIIEKEKEEKITRLRGKLDVLRRNKELSLYADQALIQFDKVQNKFNRFKIMLSEKFNASELTFGRFLGTSEQVYLAVLDNLESIVHYLETMNSIDLDYVESRLKHLSCLAKPETADFAEIETMKTRKKLREEQRVLVNQLLTHNEEAMTEIDLSMSAIAAAETAPDRASVDIEFARNELVRLAERTKNFSNK